MGLYREIETVARGWRWTRRSLTPRSAEPFTPDPPPKDFPTAWARTAAGCMARDVVQRWGLKPLVWHETSPRVEGLDQLEGLRGPVIFVANHSSHLDAPLVLCSLPLRWRERTAVGAAADYFFDARWRAAVTALAFNAFPVERHGGRRVTSTAASLLDDGWNLLLFPEGTRSPDGWMRGFRHGTARLCLYKDVPVVPIAIRGSYTAMPRGSSWARPGKPAIGVRYGPPIRPAGRKPRELTAELSQAVARLWHEEDSSWWASLRAEVDGTTPPPSGPPTSGWRRRWDMNRTRPTGERARVWR